MHGHDQTGWRNLLTGANALRTLVLCGGAGLHALNLYIAATIMPDVVDDIGGLAYFAWCTSLFVTSSIVGAASTGSLLARLGPRRGYALGALLLALGSAVCAAAPHIAVLLAGRIVQGLGGGLLLSLPYAMIRVVFPAALWTRAVAVVSGAWGVATLLGPMAGGLLADLGIWRAAFAVLVPLAIVFAGLAYAVLPAGISPAAVGVFPHAQLALLAAAVLVMSGASVLPGWFMQALALLGGGLLLAWLVRLDGRAAGGLLPRGALRRGHPLAASYLSMALLAVMVTCGEAMAPLFLQAIHGLGALGAGAMAALMSVGWSAGAAIASGAGPSRVDRLLNGSPWLGALAMAVLMLALPAGGQGGLPLLATGLAMILAGLSVGVAWPHLAARAIAQAAPGEEDLAGAAVMTVQLIATAVACACAGLVLNVAGVGEAEGAGRAARWLFGLLALAPLVCIAGRRAGAVRRQRAPLR